MSKHAVQARTGQGRASLYDEITDKIIADLEAGRVPWVQPWGTAAAKAPLAMPKNASTDRQYSGVNILLLWGAAIERGFTGQSWVTFRQALSLGGHVRKGERGIEIDIAVEIELARVHQLHHRDAGEKLGNRSWPHQRRISGERLLGIDVRKAIALCEDQAIAVYHDHHRARAFAFADPRGHQRVDHAGEIVGRQLKWR